MLLELNIKNIALIESLKIEFAKGLNALTGETGAGKSIVVDCVNLALGHRSGKEMLRTGEEKGGVKALFDIASSESAKSYLDSLGIEYDDGFVEVAREINAAGRNSCRINGTMVPLSALKEFASALVDLHGQQEHQKLLSPQNHVDYLDSFGGNEILEAKDAVNGAYSEYSKTAKALKQLKSDEKELSQKTDILTMQIKEISSAKLKPDEEDELLKKSKIYENAEKLSESIKVAYERLYAGGKSLSAQESIKKAYDAFKTIADIDPSYAELAARIEEALYIIKDIGYEVQDIYENLNFDPVEAEKTRDRLEQIKKLKRKYGPEISDILGHLKRSQNELDRIENLDSSKEQLEREFEVASAALKKNCSQLTELRKKYSGKLDKLVMEQLGDLGMGNTVFVTDIRNRKELGADGADDIEFMVSTNPGEPLKPLASIASGGEISRLMLALKVILNENDNIETMIFDEIDTGISGRMAQTVGEKMSILGKNKQVICVTHLAQIAALADTQFVVEKTVKDGRTGSSVKKLDESGRNEEISRLIGGAESEESRKEHAKSMLDGANKRKLTLRGEI